MDYECLKKSQLNSGILSGYGYALAQHEELGDRQIKFVVSIRNHQRVIFIFGFRGVGQHYRCDIMPSQNLVIIRAIKDGIPVYLQHASLRLETDIDLRIVWDVHSIRILIGKTCFINILGEGIYSGRWGFGVNGDEYRLPEVKVFSEPSHPYRWVILGDGYSNNRWPNRHFFSWPELAFGHRGDYLNACVAAGNTRRVSEVIELIQNTFIGADVILAAGADDFIEGTSSGESMERIQIIVARLKILGARSINVCAIPPRACGDSEVIARNIALRGIAATESCGFIDFHGVLSENKQLLLVNGDYPGATAQAAMAVTVLNYLGLDSDLAPLFAVERIPRFRGFAARIARRVVTELESGLDRLPPAGVS